MSEAESLHDRFHGWFLDAIRAPLNRIHDERKRRLLGSLSGTVVEIGAGTGANFDYFAPSVRLIAAEPNAAMRRRLAARIEAEGRSVEVRGSRGEQLDFDDGVADAVVSTLVLCSVDGVADVLAEIARILRPGGRFVFIEHVAAPPRTGLRLVQEALHRPHAWVFEGCQTNRDTEAALCDAGFALESIERFRVPSLLYHVSPHIAGTAIRA